ncbi:MAG: replicative DNA helicase [Gammaproteobacteria bacterium]|nr:replicative DNA helicase [Gammaproteobacteria bacterium]
MDIKGVRDELILTSMSEDYDTELQEYLANDTPNHTAQRMPHSMEAERAVLASVMGDTSAWDRLTGLLEFSEFFEPKNRKIFQTIRSLANQGSPLDHLTVCDALRRAGLLDEVGGYPYLYEIQDTVHDSRNVETYAKMVRGAALRRELIGASTFIKNLAFTPEDRTSEQVLSESEERILGIAKDTAGEQYQHFLGNIVELAERRIDQLRSAEGVLPGLPSGYWDLDDLTGGFHNNDLIIIAGRPSMGKTAFALNVCEQVILSKTPRPVLFFSLEQDHSQLVIRLLAAQSAVPYKNLVTGNLTAQQMRQLRSATALLSDSPLYLVDRPNLSVEEMRSYARRVNREVKSMKNSQTGEAHNGLALVVVDYIQLMRPSRRYDSRVLEMGDITRSLKGMAKEFGVPVVALSQLNRRLEDRHDKRPKMSDLRDSGEIEQDADLIIFIYRDEVYDKESSEKGKAEIILAKHRNGPRGAIKLNFIEPLMKFEATGEEREEMSRSISSTERSPNRPVDPPFTVDAAGKPTTEDDEEPF